MNSSHKVTMLDEVRDSLTLWRYTFYRALINISLRNSGSFLGLLWEPLSTMLVSVILALVWIKVLNINAPLFEYFVYVYLGMVIWGCLASAVSNLCSTLIRNADNMTTRSLPVFSYIFEDVLLSLIPFFMSLPFVAIILAIGGYPFSLIGAMTFLCGVVLVFFTSFAFGISIGLMAFFIGDIRQIITSVMRLSFLVTPVIWRPERLGDYEYVLLFNPFYGFVHVLRNSLMNEPIKMEYFVQMLSVTGLLMTLGVAMYFNLRSKMQHRALVL